jgi:hypothetical protein
MTNPLLETASLAEFNSLINELIQGGPSRSVFKRWELDLLLDFGNCRIRQSSRSDVLRRYQRAVQKQFLRGEYNVQPLSIFLAEERARRARPSPNPDGTMPGGNGDDASPPFGEAA